MKPTGFPAWVNGEWFAPGAPAIPADDQGLQLGLSVFDSLLWEDGQFHFGELHMERLSEGAAELGIHFGHGAATLSGALHPAAALNAYMQHLQADGWIEPLMLKITLTRGRPGGVPSVIVTARVPEQLDPRGVDVALAEVRKAAGDPHEQIKSTNRMRNVLALESARAAGAWEALFATTDGHLSEGTMTNLFLVLGTGDQARYVTPALEHGCLSGVTRRVLIRELAAKGYAVEEGAVSLDDLARASEAFLTNTSQRVIPIRAIWRADGTIFPTKPLAERPFTRIARGLVAAAEALEAAQRQGLSTCPTEG
jgi:branched-chain amino acid aminotransferase